MLAMIPKTRFRPSSISFTLSLRLRGQDIQKRSSTLAFQSLPSAIKSGLDLTIWAGCDVTHLKRSPKFIECLPHYFSSLLRVTGFVFVIDCQLFVRLIAASCISECIFPKLACQIKITFPLVESRQ